MPGTQTPLRQLPDRGLVRVQGKNFRRLSNY
jgi:hypothetical protein